MSKIKTPGSPEGESSRGHDAKPLPPPHEAARPGWLLSLSLAVAVPNEIDDLYQRFRAAEGILAWMVGEAVVFGSVLAKRGDRLLFRSERVGETAELFVGLARVLAILSFAPGGVPFGEQRFDAWQLLTARYGEENARTFCHKALLPYFAAVVSDIPVTCWSEEEEPIAFGTYNARGWFEHASADDLLQLRAASYRGSAIWAADPRSLSGYAPALLSHLFQQAESRLRWSCERERLEEVGDALLLAARDRSHRLAFQVEPSAAEAWLALYRHALLTGERWLLPHEPKRKQPAPKDREKSGQAT